MQIRVVPGSKIFYKKRRRAKTTGAPALKKARSALPQKTIPVLTTPALFFPKFREKGYL
jgi:hypothetical protein